MNTVWKLHWVGGVQGLYQIWYIFFKLNMILLITYNFLVYIFVPTFDGQNTIFSPKFTYFQVSCLIAHSAIYYKNALNFQKCFFKNYKHIR